MAFVTMETLMSYVLLLCTQLSVVTSLSCWSYNIAHCNSFVTPYITPAAIKYYSKEQLHLFCDAKLSYDSCIDHMKPFCERSVKLTLQGARNSNDYLCSNEGFQLMTEHSQCYKKQGVQTSAIYCDNELTHKLAHAHTTGEKCSLADEYLYCVKDGITQICGEEAGRFVYEANIRVLQPLYRDIGCSLGSFKHDAPYHMAQSRGTGHVSCAASFLAMAASILLSVCIVKM